MRVRLKKSPRFDKKFRVTFENGKIVDFGARGYSDYTCLLYTSPSPRDLSTSRMPSSA